MLPFPGFRRLCWLALLVALILHRGHPLTRFTAYRRHSSTQLCNSNPACNDFELLLDTHQLKVYHAALRAAIQAGDKILSGSGSIVLNEDVSSKIGSRDIVTQVDKDCQAVIKAVITECFPEHSFLGEEDVAPGIEASRTATSNKKDAPNLWIVDPIDGTTNFAHGMPLSGVIIAYAENGISKETFVAWREKGAFLNGAKINCCNAQSLSEAVVSTGSPPDFLALDACLRATNVLSSKVRTVRMLGSAAIMLSWVKSRIVMYSTVACGRLTAYFEADLNVWDLCAGCLIVEEAGGRVTDVWGRDYTLTTRNLVASNGVIHDALREQLESSEMFIKTNQ